jgi:hypothetical protein
MNMNEKYKKAIELINNKIQERIILPKNGILESKDINKIIFDILILLNVKINEKVVCPNHNEEVEMESETLNHLEELGHGPFDNEVKKYVKGVATCPNCGSKKLVF